MLFHHQIVLDNHTRRQFVKELSSFKIMCKKKAEGILTLRNETTSKILILMPDFDFIH